MTQSTHEIYLRRKQKVYFKDYPPEQVVSLDHLLNLLANLERLGYTLSPDVLAQLERQSLYHFNKFSNRLIAQLKILHGDDVKYRPMYPNFPAQVKKMSEKELYQNAFLHYLGDWVGLRILPHYPSQKRPPMVEKVKLTVIELGSFNDCLQIFTHLVSAKRSLSQTDKADLLWFLQHYQNDMLPLLPEKIAFKENMALIMAYLLKHGLADETRLSRYCQTPTDVLRVAVALSDGDVSLAESTKFGGFSRLQRRILLQTLSNIGTAEHLADEMWQYRERWKRLGERLHPSEYQKHFANVHQAFGFIREQTVLSSRYAHKIEKFLKNQQVKNACQLLCQKAGEFARRLDHLLRLSILNSSDYSPDDVLNDFSQVIDQVSTAVLLQLANHFKHRYLPTDLRIFFPKGNVANFYAMDNDLPLIDHQICQQVERLCDDSLIRRFRQHPPLGKVYLDEKLMDYAIPFSQRSASKALKTLARGSRIGLPDGNFLRFFIYWQDGKQRTDIDLSAVNFSQNFTCKSWITFYNLTLSGAYHSGDITSAPNGACEFIDIDIATLQKQGIRYVVMSVNSYTEQPYCDLPICFAGLMVRCDDERGKIFEPKTVQYKFDLSADTCIAIPLIIDLANRQVIWTDLALQNNPSTNNHVHANLSSLGLISKAMIENQPPNLFDLFALHIDARGEWVDNPQQADVVFSVETGITPQDIDTILANFL